MSRHSGDLHSEKSARSSGSKVGHKRPITPTRLNHHDRSPYHLCEKRSSFSRLRVSKTFSAWQLERGGGAIGNVVKRHLARSFRKFMLNTIELIRGDFERTKQVPISCDYEIKLGYKQKLLARCFEAWKHHLQNDLVSEHESSASEKIQQFLKAQSKPQTPTQLAKPKELLTAPLEVTKPDSIRFQPSHQLVQIPEKQDQTPKKTLSRKSWATSKQTVKKPVYKQSEATTKRIRPPQTQGPTLDSLSLRNHTSRQDTHTKISDKYSTPQFKTTHWDSDEDPIQVGKAIQFYKQQRVRKIYFHWVKSTLHQRTILSDLKEARLRRVFKAWKQETELVNFKMFRAHHFHNFYLLRSFITQLTLQRNRSIQRTKQFEQQRLVSSLRRVMFHWAKQTDKDKTLKGKAFQLTLTTNNNLVKRVLTMWKQGLEKRLLRQHQQPPSTKQSVRPISPKLKTPVSRSRKPL